MKLTDEELSDLMSEAIDYAEARENGRGSDKRESRNALVAAVEKLMAAAYEAGIKQGMENARAIASYGTCPDCGAGGLSSCIC